LLRYAYRHAFGRQKVKDMSHCYHRLILPVSIDRFHDTVLRDKYVDAINTMLSLRGYDLAVRRI
jgi:hypothetical protein